MYAYESAKIFAVFTIMGLLVVVVLLIPVTTHAYQFSTPLEFGDRGLSVSALQSILQDEGFYTHPNITGFFGPTTEIAVKQFQVAHSIVDTGSPLTTGYGRVGPQTLTVLNNIQRNTPSAQMVSSEIVLIPILARDLQYGDVGEDVRQLQIFLNRHGFFVSDSGPGSSGNESTDFLTKTQYALIRFQRAQGIQPAEGFLGSVTRAKITTTILTTAIRQGKSNFGVLIPSISGLENRVVLLNEVQSDSNTTASVTTVSKGGGGGSNNDTTAPAVSLVTPIDSATVSGTVAVSANATDNVSVAGVQFKINGAVLGNEDTSFPYSINWDTTSASDTSYTLSAVARDTSGNYATSSSASVNVSNSSFSVADQTLEFGVLTLANAGGISPAVSGGTITNAAIDSGNGLDHWQVSNDGTLTPTVTGDTDDLSAGAYTLGMTFSDGTATDTANVTINTEANVYSVTDNELQAVVDLGSATIDGKMIKGRPGADIGGVSTTSLTTFPTSLNFATGLTVTSDDSNNPSFVRRLNLGHIGPVEFVDITIRDYFSTSTDVHDNTRVINFQNNASGRSELTLRRVDMYADDDISTQDYAGGNVTALKLIANDGGVTYPQSLYVIDSTMHDFARAITGTFYDLFLTGNTFEDAAADFVSLAPIDSIGTWHIEDNTVQRAWGNSDDPQNPHMDAFQFNMEDVTGSNPIVTIRGNRIMSKGGRESSIQGVFIENQETGDASFVIENNIIITRSANGITIERPSAASSILFNSVLSDVSNSGENFVPKINIIDAQGSIEIAHNAAPAVLLTNSLIANVHDNFLFGINEADNENVDYANLFEGTDFGTDDIIGFDELVTSVTPSTGADLDPNIGSNIGTWYYDWDTSTYSPPPLIKDITDVANGSTAATGTIYTNISTGTIYWLVSENSSTPTDSNDFKNGVGAEAFGSLPVSASGTQSISISGLTTNTVYYTHVFHEDLSGQQSAVLTGDGFTLGTPPFMAQSVDNQGSVYGATTGYSGGSSSQTGAFSFWFYVDAASWPSSAQMLYEFRDSGSTPRFTVSLASSGRLSITGRNSANSTILSRLTSTGAFSPETWHHVLFSYDLSAPSADLYIDNVPINSFAAETTLDDTIPALTQVGVFSTRTGSSLFDGFMADVWFDHVNDLDLASSTVRANFIDQSTVKPIDIVSYGSPHLRLINNANSWFTNTGSGGNLTETDGSLITASSSPSD